MEAICDFKSLNGSLTKLIAVHIAVFQMFMKTLSLFLGFIIFLHRSVVFRPGEASGRY